MAPNTDRVNNILVGSGAMGTRIRMVFSLAGYGVTVQDVEEVTLEKGVPDRPVSYFGEEVEFSKV